MSVPSQCITAKKSSVRGRKRGRPLSKYKRKGDGSEWNPEKSRTIRGRKRGRPQGSSNNKSRASLSSPIRKSVKVSVRNKEHLPDTDKGTVKEDCPSFEDKTGEESGGEKIECFVCCKNVDNGISMHTLTNTTKVYMHHRLDKVVRGEMELLIEEESILCARCASLLNYIDRIEVELNMLTKVVLDCIRKKYGMGVTAVDKGHENLLPDIKEHEQDCIDDVINLDLQLSSKDETSSQWMENEVCALESSDSIRNDSPNVSATNEKHESPHLEEIQCRVCRFRTSYKSVMIFHLRQHLKPTYWCDFCNVDLPEGATSWVEDQSHIITNIDLVDERAIVEMQDEIVQQENETNDNGIKEVIGSDTIMLPKSMDQIMSIMPVSTDSIDKVISPEAVVGSESTEEAVRLPDESIVNSSSLHHMQSINNNVKHIGMLDEIGVIVTQEDSQFPSQNNDCSTEGLTVEPQELGDKSKVLHILSKCLVDSDGSKDSALKELGLTMKQTGSRQFRVLSEMGMIEVASVESTEQLLIDNLNSDVNEMRVNVTPGMMTYSNNDRRLNASLVDNSSELNLEVL